MFPSLVPNVTTFGLYSIMSFQHLKIPLKFRQCIGSSLFLMLSKSSKLRDAQWQMNNLDV